MIGSFFAPVKMVILIKRMVGHREMKRMTLTRDSVEFVEIEGLHLRKGRE